MNTALLATYMKLATLTTLVSDRVALKREEGQTAAEYIGVLVVLAAIIAVVMTFKDSIGNTIAGAIREAIQSMSPS